MNVDISPEILKIFRLEILEKKFLYWNVYRRVKI